MSHWIKVRLDLIDDPAVIGISAATGIDEFGVVGRLVALWSWADRHTTDGNALCVTESWVDRHVNATGFSQAMVQQGWLIVNGEGITFPAFEKHNGQSAKRRALTANRAAKSRGKSNATVTPEALQDAQPEKSKRKNTSSPLPPPTSASIEDDWQAVAVVISKLGVADVSSSVSAASSAGLSPTDVNDIVAHWRTLEDGLGPGALSWRLKNSRPGQPVSEGWPPLSESKLAEQRRIKRDESEQKKRMASNQARNDSGREKEQVAELERQFGATLDAMESNILSNLEREAAGKSLEMFRRTPALLRIECLKILAAREGKGAVG